MGQHDEADVLPAPPAGLTCAIGLVTDTGAGLEGMDDASLLSAARAAGALADRARALELAVLAAMSARGTTTVLAGQQTPAWLRGTHRVSAQQARARVRQATRIADRPRIAEAVGAGRMSIEQADAVISWLGFLDPDLSACLSAAEVTRIEQDLIGHAARLDPDGLRAVARHSLEVAAPDIADRIEQAALDRQEREARKRQYLRWSHDPEAGATFLRAKLPDADADQIKALIEAHTAAARRDRAGEGLGPADLPLTEALRADALIALAATAAASGTFPAHGGDRPRLTILINTDQLTARTGAATIGETGRRVSPGWWLHAACDADLLPTVVDTTGVPLDVGRTRRLVGAELRQALALRDGGCAFPGCDRPARACEAHHIVPWAAGGPTSLANTVLLCRHHHGLVEPDPRSTPHTRWQARMGADQIPEFLPPDTLYGPHGPQRHTRYRIRTRTQARARNNDTHDPEQTGNTGPDTAGPDPP